MSAGNWATIWAATSTVLCRELLRQGFNLRKKCSVHLMLQKHFDFCQPWTLQCLLWRGGTEALRAEISVCFSSSGPGDGSTVRVPWCWEKVKIIRWSMVGLSETNGYSLKNWLHYQNHSTVSFPFSHIFRNDMVPWWLNPPAFAASRRRNNGMDLVNSVLAEGKTLVGAMCGLHVTYISINTMCI